MRRLAAALLVLAACVGDDPAPSSSGGAQADASTPPPAPPPGPTPPPAPPPGDGGSDAPLTQCAKTFGGAAFCDDFDGVVAPRPGWITTGNPGALTTALAFSAPNGFRFETPQATVATTSGI